MSLFLAQSRLSTVAVKSPLSGVKRTSAEIGRKYFCVIVGTMLLEPEQRRHPARLLTTNPQVILWVLH